MSKRTHKHELKRKAERKLMHLTSIEDWRTRKTEIRTRVLEMEAKQISMALERKRGLTA